MSPAIDDFDGFDPPERALSELEKAAEDVADDRSYSSNLTDEQLPRLKRVIERLRRKAWDMEHGELL